MSKMNDLIQRSLGEPARNIMHAMYDDYVEINVRFRSRSGVKTFIVRRQLGKCCDWCKGLAGTYEKGKEPDDIYRRHDNCKCMVTFLSEKGKYVDAWSKQEFDSQRRARVNRVKELEKASKSNAQRRVTYARRKSVEIDVDSDIIKTRGLSNHNLANGLRRSPLHILDDGEIKSIRDDAVTIGVPESVLRFNEGSQTGFDDDLKVIYVRGDILPDTSSTHIRDRLSQKAVLAHEYYGHYKSDPSPFRIGDWRDEFKASYRAALDTPNLDDDERRLLMLDAYERAKEAGVNVRYNSKARRIIYGYE